MIDKPKTKQYSGSSTQRAMKLIKLNIKILGNHHHHQVYFRHNSPYNIVQKEIKRKKHKSASFN